MRSSPWGPWIGREAWNLGAAGETGACPQKEVALLDESPGLYSRSHTPPPLTNLHELLPSIYHDNLHENGRLKLVSPVVLYDRHRESRRKRLTT